MLGTIFSAAGAAALAFDARLIGMVLLVLGIKSFFGAGSAAG